MAVKRVEPSHSIVYFDGVCNLCNKAVQFIFYRDTKNQFFFAPLRSESDSILLVENGRVYRKSTAILRIARHLSGLWSLAYAFILIPTPLRDKAYDWVAARRYRLFGRRDHCMVPTESLKSRFLMDEPLPHPSDK